MPKKYEDGLTPQQRYNRKNVKNVTLNFNMSTESDVYNHIQRQPNKQGYIKGLIRQDMEKENSES